MLCNLVIINFILLKIDNFHFRNLQQPPPKVDTKPKPPVSNTKKTIKSQNQYDENGAFAFMNNPTYRVWVYSIGR